MRFFIDTEFSEGPGYLNLISIGIVAEDDREFREFYAVNKDFNNFLSSDWIKENVIPHLPPRSQRSTRPLIRKGVEEFINSFEGPPEFWGYYCSYDWVAFCQLFDRMTNLPEGWTRYIHDLKPIMNNFKVPDEILPKKPERHHALEDARWMRLVYNTIVGFTKHKAYTFNS